MANFRELTKQEKKQFRIFEKGYVEGLKGVSPNEKKENLAPDAADIMDAFKKSFIIFMRNKKRYKDFADGYTAGYFRAMTSDQHRAFLDPELNESIHEYLQNTWLHDKVFGKGEANG